jgi:hypothetical protein
MFQLNNTIALAGLALLLWSCSTTKKLDKETAEWRYQVEAVNTGVQGTYQIKVWTYAEKVEWAEAQAPKNAVHAVVFKGFPSKGRVKGQKPLVRDVNAMETHKAFFDQFFKDGGEYARFVTLVDSGSIGPGDLVKVGKEYKVGYITNVSAAALRKYLEENEIIEALDSRF